MALVLHPFARMSFKLKSLIAASLLALVQGVATPHAQAVTKGRFSTDARYRAIRSFGIITGASLGSCTGTFISKRHLLTAAHCLTHLDPNSINSVYIGRFPLNVASQLQPYNRYASFRAYVHPSFIDDGVKGHATDIGVLEFDYDIADATIPVDFTQLSKGETVTMTGYGCDKATKTRNNSFQLGAESVAGFDANRIVLKKIETTMCPGDSGGPVLKVASDESISVVGINSYYHPIGRFFGASADRAARLDDQSGMEIREWLSAVQTGLLKPTLSQSGI